jgi:hypothetical protein
LQIPAHPNTPASTNPTLHPSKPPQNPDQRGEAALAVQEDASALMLVLCVTLAGSVLSASFVVALAR